MSAVRLKIEKIQSLVTPCEHPCFVNSVSGPLVSIQIIENGIHCHIL